jgi:hypothetical protein
MLRTLGRDPPDRRPDFAPAGAVLAGCFGGAVTETVGRSAEEVSEAKGGKRAVGLVRHTGDCLSQTAFNQVVGECLRVR